MGKDREGKFHPRKGKPSGSLRADTPGLKPISSGSYEDSLEIADKYTVGEEEPAPNLYVRHRNRNVDKKEERQQERSDAKNTKAKRQTLKPEMDVKPAEEIQFPFNLEKLEKLSVVHSDCCITVYQSTHSSGVEVNELLDNTSFKSTLQQLNAQLLQKNFSQDRIDRMLKPGFDLLRDDKFWREQQAGLAMFITEGSFQYLKLPFIPKDEVFVNSSFYLTPLIPLLTQSEYFYLLVLSKKRAKLFCANAFGMVELIIDELPNGVDDVVRFEEKDDRKLWRTGSSGAGGGANYHGTGGGMPDEKEHIAIYFDEVDETLWKALLNNENVPLLLAGVEYLIPLYKSVAQYKPIWDDAITGSIEHEDINTLYQLARAKMQSYFDERHRKALDMFYNNSATGLTSTQEMDVIPAAHYKRVWHLFVAEGEHVWGQFDEMKNELLIHKHQQDGDEDLVDKAVLRTLLSAGDVHILPRERMPGKAIIAALMRYPV